MSTHTPGPWASDEMIHNMMEFRIYSSAGKIIARVQDFTTFREDVEQAEANAALIAAAPAMLEALKGCERVTKAWLADMKDYPLINPEKAAATMELIRIQEAIRLAEGRG